jgi:hypothetical protein
MMTEMTDFKPPTLPDSRTVPFKNFAYQRLMLATCNGRNISMIQFQPHLSVSCTVEQRNGVEYCNKICGEARLIIYTFIVYSLTVNILAYWLLGLD